MDVDTQGRRVQRTYDSVTTDYFYLGATVIAEKTGSAWTDYIFFGGQRIAQNTGTSLSTTKFLHPDHLGSTRVCTDSDGSSVGNCDYEPFGEFRGTCSVPTAFRFAGMQWDEDTGLYHTWFREYDATQGRWTGVDPLSGDVSDPQTFNRYVYVSNDSVNFVDPAGTCALWFGFHMIHALVDVATGETISYQVVGFIPVFCLVDSLAGGNGNDEGNQLAKSQLENIASGKFASKEKCKQFLEALIKQNNLKTSLSSLVNQITSAARAAMSHIYDGPSATAVPLHPAKFPGAGGNSTVADEFAANTSLEALSQSNGAAVWIRTSEWRATALGAWPSSYQGSYGAGTMMHELLHKKMVGGGFSHGQLERALAAAGASAVALGRNNISNQIASICF